MEKLVIATNNQGKVREIKALLEGVYKEIVSLRDAGIVADVVEDGDSFYENARKKAIEISRMVDCDVLADDSGLCVEALGGAPGIYSARFAGEDATDEENNCKLIGLAKNIPAGKRQAKFVCAIVMVRGGRELLHVEGEVYGEIVLKPRGTGGFGYDPLFYVEAYNQTFGELESDIKNKISHRARALARLKEALHG
jgi:XTP/dITP diphosphohydrolase